MRGSRNSNPTIKAARAVALVSMLAPVLSARAADFDQPSAAGPPVVLFSLDPPASTPPVLGRNAGSAAPTKRSTTPVQRIPIDGKPLIPPAPVAGKLGPPPAPRPALSLETDLQPLAPSPASPAGAANPAAPKTPSS